MVVSGGVVQWNPSVTGLYGAQVIIADPYSSIAVDFIVRVKEPQVSLLAPSSVRTAMGSSRSPFSSHFVAQSPARWSTRRGLFATRVQTPTPRSSILPLG